MSTSASIRAGMIILALLAGLWTLQDLRQFTHIDPKASQTEIRSKLDNVLERAMQKYAISGVAAGAIRQGKVIWSARAIEDLRDVALAAAGAYVSGDDMARFLLAHIDGGNVLTPSSLSTAFAPTEPNARFAMSYSRWETPEGLLIGHGGNNSSWNTQIYLRPDTQDGFYFLSNSTSGAQLDFDLSCAWLSMIEVEEGAARCAEAIDLTHKLSWAAYSIVLLAMFIFTWLLTSIIIGKRALLIRPGSQSKALLAGRMLLFIVVMGVMGVAFSVFYTDILMWRTEVTLIDEMPVHEIGRLITAASLLLISLSLALWSSPARMHSAANP